MVNSCFPPSCHGKFGGDPFCMDVGVYGSNVIERSSWIKEKMPSWCF